MSRKLTAVLLASILLVAALLRFTGLDWDDYHHYHPDERYIAWVGTTIERPSSWDEALDPHRSPLNPFYWPPDADSEGIVVPQDERRDFAYGHLPLYLGVAATRLAERVGPALAPSLPPDWPLTRDLLNGRGAIEFRHLTAVSRALTALFDLGTIVVTFWLGRMLFGGRAGLLAAALLAATVLHAQLAHFFVVDPYLTFFAVTAVALLVRGVGGRSGRRLPFLLGGGAAIGLAVGSKFSAVLLLLSLTVAFWLWRGKGKMWWWGTAVLLAGLTFALTNPYALLDQTCDVITPAVELGPLSLPRLNWGSCYLQNIATQSAMVRGEIDLPFTRQYLDTTPYLYFLEMQLRWGMGPLLGAAALAGLGWIVWRWGQDVWWFWRVDDSQLSIVNYQLSIILAWVLPFLLTTGSFYVKFMRYVQPVAPFLLIFAAGMLLRMPWPRIRWGATAVVLGGTAVFALAFVNVYDRPHPWVAASRWIYDNVPPGTLILSEQWDEPLPTTMQIGDELRRMGEYGNAELSWLTGKGAADDRAKLRANLNLMAEAEYLVITSNRVYGVVPRRPEWYPLSGQYHQLLFDGALGYGVVEVYGRFPHLGDFHLKPDTFSGPELTPPDAVAAYLAQTPGVTWGRADESFLVYDQPLTMIFRNVEGLTAAEMEAAFRE